MKVLFVATVSSHIKAFHIPYLKWFKEQGWQVHVAAGGDIELPYCDEIHNIPFERKPLKFKNLMAYKKINEIVNNENFDVIHCHTPTASVLARIVANQKKHSETKIFYTAHGFHFFKGSSLLSWAIYYPLERWLIKYTDVLITINKEDFRRAKQFGKEKVKFIPGVGIDAKNINALKVDIINKKKELNICSNEFILLSVGELIKRKNHETIIRAIALLNNPNIRYVICGKGPLESYLKDLSIRLKVDNQILFLGFRKDIVEICKISDVFVFPSFQEGLPVALMEAMAAGLPVICSNIRGNTDLIENHINGYLSDPKSVDGFAKNIKKIISHKNNVMSINNEKKIMDYDLECVMEKMKDLYLEGIKDY